MAEKPLALCPKELFAQKKWGKGKVIKYSSAGAGLICKVSGVYITDYRSDKYKEAAKKDSAASKPTESKPAASGSNPAAKSETKPAKSTSKT